MSFDIKNFGMSSVGLADIPNRFAYTTETDDLGAIAIANYFLEGANLVKEGDIILVKTTAIIPFELAEFSVTAIGLDADGIPTSITISSYVNPALSAGSFPVIESPAFDTADTIYMGIGTAGTVTNVRAVLNGTNTTAPVTLTFKIGGVAITDGTLLFGATDPVGTQLVQALSAPNSVSAGSSLEVECSGGGAAITATVTYTIS